ncbi:dual 3',5'-cyclic-AMP and -GMP phosphodiesterase 11 isoform X1 [Aplysia californica]|uniref:Dual 3',5'-cyclic-AMP and -GMP phosphodiesterase 11 isoform X1 n=1 Tax=Aplysia californica TaxID=6500 RepID=A0ABM0JVJ3_APLCA|nr:dual 3',5'-cyclic-AMP and -GMP phosphodiesterase 11 isoform X1 [Aplysia californica]
MGCSASSTAALSQGDVIEKKDSSQVIDNSAGGDKSMPKSNKVSAQQMVKKESQTSSKGIRISTKAPREQPPPFKKTPKEAGGSMAKNAHTDKGGGADERIGKQLTSSQQGSLPGYLTDEKNILKYSKTSSSQIVTKRSSVIARKLESDRIEDEASVDIPMSTKTPKEHPGPASASTKTSSTIATSMSVSSTVAPVNDIILEDNLESSSVTNLTQRNGSNICVAVKNVETTEARSCSTSDLSPNIEAKLSIAQVSTEEPVSRSDSALSKRRADKSKHRGSKSTNPSTPAGSLTAVSKSNENVDGRPRSSNSHRHHHHHHHHHHPHHHAKYGTHSKITSPKKTFKFTSKDEKTQFFVKTVKSNDENDEDLGDTKDILIQTDVVTVNDHNEKSKKKLLIKMKKLGSKESGAKLRMLKPRQGSEKGKNKGKEKKKHGENEKEKELTTEELEEEGRTLCLF